MTLDAPLDIADLTGFEYSTHVQRPEGEGYVEIQYLSEGDLAMARCDKTGEIVPRTVFQYAERSSVEIIRVETQSDIAGTDSIGTTAAQLFWVKGRGWVEARSLTAGDDLLSINGVRTIVLAVRDDKHRAEIFHIKVEGLHTFFAGNHGVLVHDTRSAHRVSAASW